MSDMLRYCTIFNFALSQNYPKTTTPRTSHKANTVRLSKNCCNKTPQKSYNSIINDCNQNIEGSRFCYKYDEADRLKSIQGTTDLTRSILMTQMEIFKKLTPTALKL